MVHIAKLASFAAIVSASDILVSLKGVTSKCFGEELANNELLVLKAELQNPAGALMNMFVVSGITEANDIDLRKLEKKNILFQESRKSQIGTAITSLLVSIEYYAYNQFRRGLTGYVLKTLTTLQVQMFLFL